MTIVVPVIMLLWTALLPFYQLFSIRALPLLTLANFELVLSAEPYLVSMKHSLILAGSTATLVVCITAVMGWCIARQMRGGRLMDILAAVPLAFPAIVFSFAF
ncbi:MAG TPA: hypothetical protein VG900_07600, partial [Hyphomicrobiaceae bacterium]|nr:hypothetical protein [Hyphomicrobiaceae bacterium]